MTTLPNNSATIYATGALIATYSCQTPDDAEATLGANAIALQLRHVAASPRH